MSFVYYAHSGLRFVVLLAGVAALLYLLAQTVRGRPFDRPARLLTGVYAGLLDLQILLGLVLLVLMTFYAALTGHFIMMLLAAVTVHVASIVNRRRPAAEQSPAMMAAAIGLSLLLIVGGILAIGRGLFTTSVLP